MATISFRAKLQTVTYVDGTHAYTGVSVPVLKRAHCDMQAFREHKYYGAYANSDLFPGMLAGIRKNRLGNIIKIESLPPGVRVDASGFLAVVSIDI